MAGLSVFAHHLLLMCVVWRTWFQCISQADQTGCRRLRFASPFDGKRLRRHVFLKLTIGTNTPCEHRCVMEQRCMSINIGLTDNGKVVCELSDSDHFRHPEDLEQSIGWTYRGTTNPCSSNPCFLDGMCVNVYSFSIRGFVCSCPAGYTGEQCERDIDECRKESSHDCHKNATCINTAGHFICNCNPGHTGDGRLCSDCSSGLLQFKKYQELPTSGASDVESLNIDGNPFLVFGNVYDELKKHQTESFVYKMNISNC